MLLVGTKNKATVTFDELLQIYIDINKEVKENENENRNISPNERRDESDL